MKKELNTKKEMEKIACEYLFIITNYHRAGYFIQKEVKDYEKFFLYKSFNIIDPKEDNYDIVDKENSFEGMIRCYLVNPIIKMLFDYYEIESDWFFGDGKANHWESNKEYEFKNLVEFVIKKDGQNIGYQYSGFVNTAAYLMSPFNIIGKDKIQLLCGFDKISSVDKIIPIDWSGVDDDVINEMFSSTDQESFGLDREISLKAFFLEFFSEEEYYDFIDVTSKAVREARRIVALKVIPQLTTNNLLQFKEKKVLGNFNHVIETVNYEFNSYQIDDENGIDENDLEIINKKIEKQQLTQSLIGKSDFSKSFITAEYLFNTIDSQLGIDYTPVVLGYVKSVEQLMYIIYNSFFEGKSGKEYWDKCNLLDNFDINLEKYREFEYTNTQKNKKEPQKQEFYYHKRVKPKIMNMGKLITFLRSNSVVWELSDCSMKYIIDCFDDYRAYSRNGYLHKDMINHLEYKQVVRIRNNTIICLYYLLGAFKLLNENVTINEQLSIVDLSFENMVLELYLNRNNTVYKIKIEDEYEGYIRIIQDDFIPEYDEWGLIKNDRIKVITMNEEDIGKSYDEVVNNDRNRIIEINRDMYLKKIGEKRIKRNN